MRGTWTVDGGTVARAAVMDVLFVKCSHLLELLFYGDWRAEIDRTNSPVCSMCPKGFQSSPGDVQCRCPFPEKVCSFLPGVEAIKIAPWKDEDTFPFKRCIQELVHRE